MDTIWIRYRTLPELSVDGFHANVTVVWVVAVARRFVGVVGALRSFAARTGAGLRSNASTTRIAAATLAMRQNGLFLIMLCLLSQIRTLESPRGSLFKYTY